MEIETVKRVLFKIDHHLIRMPDGTDSSWLDSLFMHEVEDAVPPVIDALLAGQRTTASLHARDRRGVALFVNLLRASVPARIAALEADIERSAELSARLVAWRAAHTGNPDPAEARREFAVGGAIFDVLASGQTDELVGRAWQLFRVAADAPTCLILGDDPVLEIVAPSSDRVAHLLLAFALDPWTLLVMHPYPGSDEPPAALTPSDVEAINSITWNRALNEAVARAKSDLDLGKLTSRAGVPDAMLVAARRAHPSVFP